MGGNVGKRRQGPARTGPRTVANPTWVVDNPPVSQIEDTPDPTPAQVRAARALLGWTRSEVARRFEIGDATVARLERGDRVPGPRILPRIKEGFESAGIVFFNDERGCGVALATPQGVVVKHPDPRS